MCHLLELCRLKFQALIVAFQDDLVVGQVVIVLEQFLTLLFL